jgi:hypothetical protein
MAECLRRLADTMGDRPEDAVIERTLRLGASYIDSLKRDIAGYLAQKQLWKEAAELAGREMEGLCRAFER